MAQQAGDWRYGERVLLASVFLVCGQPVARAKPEHPVPPVQDLRMKESVADDVWDKMPMAARRVLFVTGPVKQFGAYEPRGDNVFKENETVFTYVEPVGFVFRGLGNGVMAYGFKVSLTAKGPDGTVLLDKPEYATLDSRTRSRKHDVEFASSLELKGLKAGTHTLVFTFSDLYSDKRMVVSQTFRLVR